MINDFSCCPQIYVLKKKTLVENMVVGHFVINAALPPVIQIQGSSDGFSSFMFTDYRARFFCIPLARPSTKEK